MIDGAARRRMASNTSTWWATSTCTLVTDFRNPPAVFPGKFAIIAISSGAK
jgi:hypothetical protein